MGLLANIESYFETEEQKVVAELLPYIKATASNLVTMFEEDAVAFIKAAAPVALAAAEGAIAGGATGQPILGAVAAAVIPLAEQMGIKDGKAALASVTNTLGELIHQPAVQVRIATAPETPPAPPAQ